MNDLIFKEDTHEYFLGDKKLISVTQLMQKHGLAPNYRDVPSEVLRAKAERGSLVHKEIEEYIKNGSVGFTTELSNFINAIKENNTEVLQSEFKVYNDIVAGTCDLVLAKEHLIIADIKTTATLHMDAVSWQLSIYAYLYWLNHDLNIKLSSLDYNTTKGQAYHFDKDSNLKIVDIQLKPFEEIDRLMECERKGETYQPPAPTTDDQLTKLVEVETLIKSIEEQKKQAEEQAKELRTALMEAMEKQGVKTFENDRIKITYVAPSTRQSVDSAKLKKEQPSIYEQYLKTSEVKASLKITLRENKNNE